MNGAMVAAEKNRGRFGSNLGPTLPLFYTHLLQLCRVFLYTSFYLLNGEWGGVRYETEEKEASPSSGEKNSNLTSFLQFVAFSVSFSAVLFKGKIFIKFQIQIYRKMCGQLFFFIEHW